MKKLLGIVVLGLLWCNNANSINFECTLIKSEPLGDDYLSEKKSKKEVVGSKAEIQVIKGEQYIFINDPNRGRRRFDIDATVDRGIEATFMKVGKNISITDSIWFGIASESDRYFLGLRNVHVINQEKKEVVSIHIEYHCDMKK